MYSKRTTSLSKQDIREIPFDELAATCSSNAKLAVQDALDKLQSSLDYMYKEALAKAGEEGEGYAEDFSESNHPFVAKVPPEKALAIKQLAYRLACVAFCEKYTLKARSSWLPAQLVALVAKWQPKRAAGINKATDATDVKSGYCARATLDAVLGSGDKWLIGCYYFMMYAKRGDYLGTQYKEPDSYYCALVPLILSGFLKYHKVAYTSWNREYLELIVEPGLYEAITCTIPADLTTEELLGIREAGMVIRTGIKAGTSRSPVSTYKLWGVTDSMIGKLPWLAQVMLTQIWCAHPSNCNKYMILDPSNWDVAPAALISTQVLVQDTTPVLPKRYLPTYNNMPNLRWDE